MANARPPIRFGLAVGYGVDALLVRLALYSCAPTGGVNSYASAAQIRITTGLAERLEDPAEILFVYWHERCHQTLGHVLRFQMRRDLRLELAADACAIRQIDRWGMDREAVVRHLARGIRGRNTKGAFAEIATRAAAIRFLPRAQ